MTPTGETGTGETVASWEETKQAAQSVHSGVGAIYQDMHGSIGMAYQQILMGRGIMPDRETALNYEIAQSAYDPTPEGWKDYERYVDESSRDYPDPEPEEPEIEM